MHIVATAGHVDHGKSTLVRALTGVDPDRLAEEKRRGLTIDLGFAATTLPSGRGVSFVDVPGHVRFVKNMLAGVGAVDAVLLVVSAAEGWKPQTEEHLRILELLGIGHGLVALTHVGVVDDDTTELARLEIADRTAGSFLADADVVAVDAVAGVGLDDLRAGLDALTARTPTAVDRGRPRLWIDRSFVAAGAGRVVTGTLAGGSIAVGDVMTLAPGGATVRVRAVESHNLDHDSIGPGRRVALNLAGADADELRRGVAVCRPGQWHTTSCLDASLTVMAGLGHEVTRRGAYALYLGSGEWPVRLRVLGPSRLAPGETGSVRLFVREELPLLPGDRFVLRESGRDETVGGGTVLDVDPRLRAADAAPDLSVDRVVAERGWTDVDELERLTGERRSPVLGNWVAPAGEVEALRAEVREAVAAAGPLGLDVARLDERRRLALESLDDVAVVDGRARAPAEADVLADHPVVARLAAEPFSPPAPDDVDAAELRELARRGLIVNAEGVWFAAAAVDQAARRIARLLAERPDGVTMAEIRDALATTRKFALPLAGCLDRAGVTRRRDDLRIAGPRLPAPE
ncbi:MAG TPA: selenocysteine-specific translation elongation factor [Acidimicrobiaceae bacterium]|nr:selenocysteine-specific translation elongation factor [Acidimicrobiaceae bacterium]HCB37880.1 selenocysteine-specific translation elongation factor [Acidimicrobiaceae bacterium]